MSAEYYSNSKMKLEGRTTKMVVATFLGRNMTVYREKWGTESELLAGGVGHAKPQFFLNSAFLFLNASKLRLAFSVLIQQQTVDDLLLICFRAAFIPFT